MGAAHPLILSPHGDTVRLGIHEDSVVLNPTTMKPAAPLFKDYAQQWLKHRTIKKSTRALYSTIIRRISCPGSAGSDWTPSPPPTSGTGTVPSWWTPPPGAPTYALLRTILNSEVAEDVIAVNPCKVKGAGQSKRASRTDLPTPEQVVALVAAMPGPKYQTLTLLAAWTGLRFGELTELRRKDIVAAGGVPVAVRVRRAVYDGLVTTPKSGAGMRDGAIPPHVRQPFARYLESKVKKGPESLLFPATTIGGHMPPNTVRNHFYAAREEAGLPGLRFHDLRHFSATTAAQTGASVAELQRRLGHSTVNAAMRYQHAAQSRDAEIAEAMSALAGNPPPLRAVK